MKRLPDLLLAAVLMLCAGAAPASAQTHTVEIRDGVVVIDGRTLEKAELPESLNLEGMSADMRFSGDAHFQLNGTTYRIESGRLVEMDHGKDEFVVYFQSSSDNPAPRTATVWVNQSPVYGSYLHVLNRQADALDRLGSELSGTAPVGLQEKLIEETEQTVAMVRAFPRIEMEGYLRDIEGRDKTLYDRMVREQLMEIETRRLASRIISTSDETRRAELTGQLRSQLEDIFELKQQNRRDEIGQLEGRLDELRQQLSARESARARLVERRMVELLHSNN